MVDLNDLVCIEDFYKDNKLICKKGDKAKLFVGRYSGKSIVTKKEEVNISDNELARYFNFDVN